MPLQAFMSFFVDVPGIAEMSDHQKLLTFVIFRKLRGVLI